MKPAWFSGITLGILVFLLLFLTAGLATSAELFCSDPILARTLACIITMLGMLGTAFVGYSYLVEDEEVARSRPELGDFEEEVKEALKEALPVSTGSVGPYQDYMQTYTRLWQMESRGNDSDLRYQRLQQHLSFCWSRLTAEEQERAELQRAEVWKYPTE